jgi:serine/threonine protein kinase
LYTLLSLECGDNPADEWEYISSQLDEAPAEEVSGVLYQYKLLDLIDRNGSPYEVPGSKSFCGRATQSPNIFVFIKFARADMINAEWDRAAQIPESPYLHRPLDASPLDQSIFNNEVPAPGPRFHFIVSPLIFGDDLFQILVDAYNLTAQISCGTLINVFRQIIAGLALLHAKRIVHGDMKPENLMWDLTAGCVRIIDFGYSVAKGGRHPFGTTGLKGDLAEIIQNMVKWDPQERSTAAEICCLMGREPSGGRNV